MAKSTLYVKLPIVYLYYNGMLKMCRFPQTLPILLLLHIFAPNRTILNYAQKTPGIRPASAGQPCCNP